MLSAKPDALARRGDAHKVALRHALIVLPVVVTVSLFLRYESARSLGVDFHYDFWVAGERVRHALSPYFWTRQQISGGPVPRSFPYPALAALLFVPLSLVPRGLIDPAFVVLCIAAPLLTLRVLQVRDWRLYSVVLLWWPVINGWQTANLTLLLCLGIACVWRLRESPAQLGVLIALLVSVKPVVWPLGLWLLTTKRFRACGYGAVAGIAFNLIAWPVLGLDQVSALWHLLGRQTDILWMRGYGLPALVGSLGAGRGVGTALELVTTGLLVAACGRLARKGREREILVVCVGLMLASSPLVDNHYFALLIVPLAVLRPYLCAAWLLPLVLWLCPAMGAASWQILLAWAVTAATIMRLAAPNTIDSAMRLLRLPSGHKPAAERARAVAPPESSGATQG